MTARPRSLSSGFTLLELMISIALVLVLMLAITKIFGITSTTIGASQGFAAATRDARAAQAVFVHDIGSMAPDSPWIWIRYNTPKPAFRNAEDEKNDKKYDITAAQSARDTAKLSVDLNDNGVEGEPGVPGEAIAPYAVNNRNHRQDMFSFCARDRFYRQTGNTAQNTLVSAINGPEAWITYEHLVLPYTNGQFRLAGSTTPGDPLTNPGDGTALTNPLNYYASQWVLGRVAMVMVLPTNAPSGNSANEFIYDSANVSQEYFRRGSVSGDTWNYPVSQHGSYAMTPFSDQSSASVNDSAGKSISLSNARYDLIGSDIASLTNIILKNYITDSVAYNRTTWYANMLASRFQVNPLAIKPINAATASQQVPIFLPACSQFIVEFAGDFVTQNAYGGLDDTQGVQTNYGLQPDGQIDFHYNRQTGTREIQWYGLPRSPSGNLTISCANGDLNANTNADVMLLSDYVQYISGAGFINATGTAAAKISPYAKFGDLQSGPAANPNFATFEHDPNSGVKYTAMTTGTANRALNTTYLPTDTTKFDSYYCAWDPSTIQNPARPRPKMYRITLVIDRPELAGRTTDGQTFEYVFSAP